MKSLFKKTLNAYVFQKYDLFCLEGISLVNTLYPTKRLRFHNKWFIYSEEPVLVEGMFKKRRWTLH